MTTKANSRPRASSRSSRLTIAPRTSTPSRAATARAELAQRNRAPSSSNQRQRKFGCRWPRLRRKPRRARAPPRGARAAATAAPGRVASARPVWTRRRARRRRGRATPEGQARVHARDPPRAFEIGSARRATRELQAHVRGRSVNSRAATSIAATAAWRRARHRGRARRSRLGSSGTLGARLRKLALGARPRGDRSRAWASHAGALARAFETRAHAAREAAALSQSHAPACPSC